MSAVGAGRGILAIWNDIRAGDEAGFVEWHSREHMPERLAVPGFLRGRRMFAADARPRWITLYEAGDPDVFESPAYLQRLADPTPGTKAVLPSFVATERMIGRVVAEAGSGSGGAVACLRLWGTAMNESAAIALAGAVAAETPAIACVVLRNVGVVQRTEEAKLRGGDLEAPDLVILAELYRRDGGTWAAPARFSDAAAAAARARTDIYQPEYELAG